MTVRSFGATDTSAAATDGGVRRREVNANDTELYTTAQAGKNVGSGQAHPSLLPPMAGVAPQPQLTKSAPVVTPTHWLSTWASAPRDPWQQLRDSFALQPWLAEAREQVLMSLAPKLSP